MAHYIIDEQIPKILDFVDIDSEKWRLFASVTNFPKTFLYNLEAKRLRCFEDELCRTFNSCVVVSNVEKQLIQNNNNLHVIANGVDFKFFSPQKNRSAEALIFTGAMNYFPNVDGIRYFHKEILPLIRAELPNLKFIIAGMAPSAEIRKLADDRTIVTGSCLDVREYLSRAAVCVVPLRIAKGIQNKILEAMAMEVPVVATSKANDGINAQNNREIMIADDPRAFSKAVIDLLRNTELREGVIKNARTFVEKNFSWERNLKRLDELISITVSN
jgi:sugar transferase (PEP-CTERM/EpsH1 system associated)